MSYGSPEPPPQATTLPSSEPPPTKPNRTRPTHNKPTRVNPEHSRFIRTPTHRQSQMPHALVARQPNPSTNSHRRQTTSKRRSQRHPALNTRYRLLSRLGHGLMGTVYRAYDNTNQTEVAIKVVLKKNLNCNTERRGIRREIGLLQQFKHNNIMTFREAFEDDVAVYIVTEYYERGDLFSYLNKTNKPLPEREALKYLRQLLHALQYLNRNGISHRDIKPENILLSSEGNVKLADFGLCFCRPPKGSLYAQRHCGTPQYSAPEIISRSAYVPEKSDMWSCGILLYAMLTQSLPFATRDLSQLQRDIITADHERILASQNLSHVSKETKRVLRALLAFDPNQRPLPMQAVKLVDDAILGPRIYKTSLLPW